MAKKSHKFIFVAGGVMSSIGKGITTASIGKILSSRGINVAAVKIDPYVNVDAGTMNPTEHGEVFVTGDGAETDQDLGNYERFLDKDHTAQSYITTGQIYQAVINKERNLEYGGRCVEVVPHIPEEVIARLDRVAEKSKADLLIVEIGGTVGEYQNLIFLEAARMLHLQRPGRVIFVLVSYFPIPKMTGEMKTKPTQYAVRTLNSSGIQPDFIIARAELPLDKPRKKKVSVFCNMAPEDVISAPDVGNIYDVPLNFEKDNFSDRIVKKLRLKTRKSDLSDWRNLSRKVGRGGKKIKIGIVGKYFGTGGFLLGDSYISVIEAIKHAAWSENLTPEIDWLNAEDYEKDKRHLKVLKKYDGIIVPGGFGNRGTEGKISAIEFCRKNNIPYLGLCLGMQLAVVEFARNVCGLKKANSTEMDPNTLYPVIDLMLEQKKNLAANRYGGTMRLGAFDCKLKKGTISRRAYGQEMVAERHRHRYEFNNNYRRRLEEKGMIVSGLNPERDLVEIMELKDHPFFVGSQFHPEFRSRPLKPHPLFRAFIRSMRAKKPARKK